MPDKSKIQIALATEVAEFDLGGGRTLTWEIGPASMSGAWARDDYILDAVESIRAELGEGAEEGATDWDRMDRTQRRRYLFHLNGGGALAGATVSLSLDGEALDVTPAQLIALPQAAIQQALGLAYKHNPNWRPGWASEAETDPN